MNRSSRFLPALSLAAGLLGALLRRLQLVLGFEADTGLAVRGSWINLLLPLFLLAAAVAMAWCARSFRGQKLPFTACFSAPRGPGLGLMTGGAMLCLISGGLYLLGYLQGDALVLDLVLGAFSLFVGLSLLYVLRSWRQNGAVEPILLLPPVIFYVLQLLAAYLDHGTFPVLARYGPEILSIAALVFGFYQVLAAGYGQARRPLLVWAVHTAPPLAITAAADFAVPAVSVSLLAGAAILLAFALSLPGEVPSRREETPAP